MAFKMKFSGFKYDPYADQKAAKQDYYNKQIAEKQAYYNKQKGLEEPTNEVPVEETTKKKFKDTKVGKFLGVGKGDQRKHNRAARKTEGTRFRQWLRRKFN